MDRESLINMIKRYINYYNTKRVQRNLGVLTPCEKHEMYLAA
ncbi:IS3 family transposase [Pectinatus frisingensis]